MCVLPLNMLNQKFYTFYFFWLWLLLLVSMAMVLTRVGFVMSEELRKINLKRFYNSKVIRKIQFGKASHGDWFLMAQLMKNMNVVMNNKFLEILGNDENAAADNNNVVY